MLLTRNVTRALSVLMVDFSCALKLAMPLAVLSAMREASGSHIDRQGRQVPGGRGPGRHHRLRQDRHPHPRLPHAWLQVVPFGGKEENDMLRLAACLEEHFPHSMANAVVQAAKDRGLSHEEMHSEVEYLVAHGIASTGGRGEGRHRQRPLRL